MTETSAAISPACESICFCGRSLSTLDIVRLPVAVVSRRAGVPGVFMSKSYTFDSLLKIFFFFPEKWKMEVLKCMASKLTLTLQTSDAARHNGTCRKSTARRHVRARAVNVR
jgi:hypothetical protein